MFAFIVLTVALAAVFKELDARAGERTNLYVTCARTLRSTIAKQRIAVCCPHDSDLPHLKFMYAQYFYSEYLALASGAPQIEQLVPLRGDKEKVARDIEKFMVVVLEKTDKLQLA